MRFLFVFVLILPALMLGADSRPGMLSGYSNEFTDLKFSLSEGTTVTALGYISCDLVELFSGHRGGPTTKEWVITVNEPNIGIYHIPLESLKTALMNQSSWILWSRHDKASIDNFVKFMKPGNEQVTWEEGKEGQPSKEMLNSILEIVKYRMKNNDLKDKDRRDIDAILARGREVIASRPGGVFRRINGGTPRNSRGNHE